MFAIIYHNEHAFDNAACERIIGPFLDRPAAIAGLHALAAVIDDSLWKIDEEEGYLGADYDELDEDERDTDMASEIWAEVVLMEAPKR